MRLLIIIFVFISTLFASTFTSLNSHAWGWSWKNLKIGITTEEDLLKNGGTPWEVKLHYQEYVKFKEKKPYSISFRYYDSKERRSSANHSKFGGKTILYDPSNIPILETAPLQLSDEVIETEFLASFYGNKLDYYGYTFKVINFLDRFDTTKYIEIFNTLLGRPVSMADISLIEYEGCHTLVIFQESNRIYRIRLECLPGR